MMTTLINCIWTRHCNQRELKAEFAMAAIQQWRNKTTWENIAALCVHTCVDTSVTKGAAPTRHQNLDITCSSGQLRPETPCHTWPLFPRPPRPPEATISFSKQRRWLTMHPYGSKTSFRANRNLSYRYPHEKARKAILKGGQLPIMNVCNASESEKEWITLLVECDYVVRLHRLSMPMTLPGLKAYNDWRQGL